MPWLIACLLLLGACGPTEAEIGSALVHAAPIMVAVGGLIQLGYARAWRAIGVDVPVRLTHTMKAFGLSCLAIIAAYARVGVDGDDFFAALLLGGASYLAILLVAMRVWVHRGARYSRAVWPAWYLIVVPGFLFAVLGPDTEANMVIALALPGYGGIVPGALALLMSIELLVRWRRVRIARASGGQTDCPLLL